MLVRGSGGGSATAAATESAATRASALGE
ncbi:MAG: hypothetical protein QOE21_165, partial [Microbacteriaceae bacterium]|nr:hypothetical protein [Microbacteriaceae bacterium]